MKKIGTIVKIDNSKNTERIDFVPQNQSFSYTVDAGDVLEFKVKNASQALYYEKQNIVGATISTQDSFDGGSQTFTITYTVDNGTYVGPNTIDENGTATITITANPGHTLPSSITVTGAEFVYSSETGVITLHRPTSNVSVTVLCEAPGLAAFTINDGQMVGGITIDPSITAVVVDEETVSLDDWLTQQHPSLSISLQSDEVGQFLTVSVQDQHIQI